MTQAPPTHDIGQLRRWIQSCTRPEDLQDLLALGVSRFTLLVYREASVEALGEAEMERVMDAWARNPADPRLPELLQNPSLVGEPLARILAWLQARMWVAKPSGKYFKEAHFDTRPLDLLDLLERAGKEIPSDFMEVFRRGLQDPEREPHQAMYAMYLVRRFTDLTSEEIPALYQAARGARSIALHLAAHPLTPPEVLLAIARHHHDQHEISALVAGRRELLEEPELRAALIERAVNWVARKIAPELTSEEYAQVLAQAPDWAEFRALSGDREPTPEELAQVVERVALLNPKLALEIIDLGGRPRIYPLLTSQAWAALLSTEDSELRMRVQRRWSRAQNVIAHLRERATEEEPLRSSPSPAARKR